MIDLTRIPPHNEDIETAVIATILSYFVDCEEHFEKLLPDDFYIPINKTIFNAIASVYASGVRPDDFTVSSYLKERNVDESVVYDIAREAQSATYLDYFISIIKERSVARKLIVSASSVVADAYNPEVNAYDTAERMELDAIAISTDSVKDKTIAMKSGEDIYKEMLDTPDVGRIFTGNSYYDNVYYLKGGSRRGQLEYVLAITGHGKTQYLAYLCAMYARNGNNVEWFQFEDSKYSTVELFLPYGSDVLKKIHITDECRNIQQVEKVLRRRKNQHDIVVVDYIQAVSSLGKKDIRERVSDVSERLRDMAKDYNCYVMGASQVGRDKTRGGYKAFPSLQDAKESGQVEQDAFVVTSVFRPNMVDELRSGVGVITNITGEEQIPDNALYYRNLKNRKQKVLYKPNLLWHTVNGLTDTETITPVKKVNSGSWYSKEEDVPF